jgi:hypothetical protein
MNPAGQEDDDGGAIVVSPTGYADQYRSRRGAGYHERDTVEATAPLTRA